MRLKEELAVPLRTLQETARKIAKVATESKLTMVEDEYVASFKVELMDAVVQWCRGASFSEICKACAFDSSVLFASLTPFSSAHGPVRGQPYPRFSSSAGAHSADGLCCEGYW